MSAAANALTNLARAAVTIGVGASVASLAIYDGARRRARATRRDATTANERDDASIVGW